MKRECLLSRTYTGSPMMLRGVEIVYSPLANEILREFETAFFNGDGAGDQTHQAGLNEGVLIMWLLAAGNRQEVARLRKLTRADRHREVLDFYLENEEEIDALKPEIIARMESAMAASVESETPGKSHQPLRESSP
jgi:hypothetical protein